MRLLLLASCLALLGAVPADAQPHGDRFGIGMRVTDLFTAFAPIPDLGAVGSVRGQTVVLPLDVGPLRIEPELGFAGGTESDAFVTETLTQIGFGAGAFYRQVGTDGLTLLYGARVRYVDARYDREVDAVEEQTVFDNTTRKARRVSLAPTLGGEMALGRRFGLGAEVGLAYHLFSGDGFDGFGTTALSVEPAVYARFFF